MTTTAAWPGIPAHIGQVPFRRLFRPLDRPVPRGAAIVTAYTDGTVTLRSNRPKTGYHEAADLSGYQGVARGDFVVHGLDIMRGSVGVSDSAGAMSSVCIVCEPVAELDPRYYAYVIRMQATSGFPKALARGVREGGADFRRWDTLAELPLPVMQLDDQRRIADFLDRYVGQVDALVQLRSRQLAQLPELTVARAGALLAPFRPEGPPMSVVSKIIDTEHKTAPTVPEGGYWIAGTSALRGGRLDHDALRETDVQSYQGWTRRGVPSAGDVLLSREAPVGEVALLEPSDPAVAIGQRVVLLKPRRVQISGGFLRLVLMSPVLQRVIADTTVGSLHPHLNIADISRLRIPAVDRAAQTLLGEEHARQLADRDEARHLLSRSVLKLGEYKQALITAAVTGEIDVSTASDRSAPV